MPRHDVRVYLHDILDASDAVAAFTEGRTMKQYRTDLMLRSAVERQFEIVGEALSQACALEPGLVDEVADARAIIGLRNHVIHGYADVDDDIVWGAIPRLVPLGRDVEAAPGGEGRAAGTALDS